jgi:hypothetical protein
MTKKLTELQSKKDQSLPPVKSIAPAKQSPKKQSKKESQQDLEGDLNSQASTDTKVKPPLYERPLMDPLPDEKKDHHEPGTKVEKEFSVEIFKAKITNEIFLYTEYKVNSKDDKGTVKKDNENPIHKDLKKAFDALTPHLAAMAEQYTNDGKLDKSQITCRGFGIGGNGEGVVLHGTRLLSNGKAFNFNTPYYKWDTEKSESLFADEAGDLRIAVNACVSEVILYLFKHKHQPEINQESK